MLSLSVAGTISDRLSTEIFGNDVRIQEEAQVGISDLRAICEYYLMN